MKTHLTLLIAALAALQVSAPALAQTATNVNWTGGPGNWIDTSRWFNESTATTGFLPSVDFNEIARIDGGVVTVNTALANGSDQGASTNPGAVRLGSVSGAGELIVANGGSLRVEDGELTNGGLSVGGAFAGALRVQRGGALIVDGPLTSAASSTNLIELGSASGVGTANLTVGSASLGGATVVHRNVTFSSASITLPSSSVYRPVFTGGVTSVLQSTGSANLGGTLRPDFGGAAPTVGSSWNLIEAAGVNGAFAGIDPSLAGNLGEGQAFTVSTPAIAGGRRAVQLSLKQLAVLSVNRDTGMVALTNPGATAISLDGYSISSTLGAISGSQWSSLQDQNALGGGWRESPPTANRLSELKQSGVGSLAAGQTISLGAVFAPSAPALGAPTEDIQLQYASPEGVFTGLVKYAGTKVNNILLQVDPSSGQARLRNPSSFSVNIDGYTITSAAGSLTPAGWTSLDDQNAAGGDWRESPGLATRLSELKQSASTTLAPGASFNLGAIFSPAMAKDLSFDFLQLGQSQPTDGIVIFAPLTAAVTPGDFDQNGVVNGQDLNRWKTAFGATTQANADGDNDSDGSDFLIWQRNLGSAGATGSGSLVASAVPEPTSFAVVIGLTAVVGVYWRAQQKVAVVSIP